MTSESGRAAEQTSSLSHTQKMLEVLSAVVIGDAGKEDVLSLLRDKDVESLDAVPRLLTHGRPISPQPDPRIEHQVPEGPFLLNGNLYDPEDVQRFNGQPLHFVSAAYKDYMLAVDDADVMVNWWRLLRLAALQYYHYRGHQSVGRVSSKQPLDRLGVQANDATLLEGPEGFQPASDLACWLHEHVDHKGDFLPLQSGLVQYGNLIHEPRGFLGLLDWNDVISSVDLRRGTACILYENIYFNVLKVGSSLTLLHPGERFLTRFGWNDRASSIEGF